MITGTNGKTLIEHFEGLRLKAYLDQGGIPTIGYGHTQAVNMGDKITAIQADQFLSEDLKTAEHYVNALVFAAINQNQFDALVSFTFNLGGLGLKKSKVLLCLNNGEYLDAASALLHYAGIGGVHDDGLYHRRLAEKKLFLTPLNETFHV